MNDRQLDEQITRAVRALAETSPEPLPLAAATPQHRSTRPVLVFAGAFAAVLLVIGLVVVLQTPNRIASTESGDLGAPGDPQPQSPDEWWEWLTEDAISSDNPDLLLVKHPPRGTRFDPRDYGVPSRVLPTGSGYALRDLSAFSPPVALVGTLEGTDQEVSVVRSVAASGEPLLCFQIQGEKNGSTNCVEFDRDVLDGKKLSLFWWSESSGDPGFVTTSSLLFAPVPWETALIVISLNDGRRFVQQPRGDVALFRFLGDTALSGTVTILDQDANTILEESFDFAQ